ncbi:MAG: autotransporter-associated beta strand repeat-containing protein, partial [Verrucomicrobiota bacterium]
SGAGGGNTGTVRYNIGGKGTDSVFSGTIQGSGTEQVIVRKTGAGTLTLDGTLTYDGSTTVSNGVLKIASLSSPGTSLDTSSGIIVRSGAFLDVSDRSDASLNIGNTVAQSVGGSGTIRGSLVLPGTAVGTINPGDAIGTLNVTNVVTIAVGSIVNIDVNRTNAQTSDKISAGGAITVNGGTLNLTNLGPDLITGDVFQVFNQATIGNFSITNLPGSNVLNTVEYVWTNKLAIDGTLVLLQGASPLASYSTNITATVAGDTITVSWPSTHLGWQLAVQTNSINVGLANNWVTNLGTASVTSTNFPINPANGAVFYRLVRP